MDSIAAAMISVHRDEISKLGAKSVENDRIHIAVINRKNNPPTVMEFLACLIEFAIKSLLTIIYR